MKKISLELAVVLILASILLSATATFVLTRERNLTDSRLSLASGDTDGTSEGNLQKISKKLAQLDAIFQREYVGDVNYDDIELGVLSGYLAGSGDRYAYYYTAEEYKEMMATSSGDSQGVGISVIWNSDEYAIEVLNIFPGGPAESSDLRVGDLIVGVGVGEEMQDVAALGYEKALSMLRGDAGTKAQFTVKRGSETLEMSIERGHYENQTVYYHKYELDDTVGIIRITEFERITPNQFRQAIASLEAEGARELIVDLRSNPGGDRDSIIEILDYILPEGPLFRLKQADGTVAVTDTSDASCIDNPIVVLTNGGTASAAELFTAAMRDYDRAKIVGTKTYGKGSMQTFYRLSDGSVFKTTSDLYYPPFSDNYDGIGIEPDVEVELDEALASVNPFKVEDRDDNQLAEAYKVLKDGVSAGE